MSALAKFAVLFAIFGTACTASATWEPERSVELVVPARADTRIDQMARLIQGIIAKHKLMKQDVVVVNRPGGDGAEAFILLKNYDPSKSSVSAGRADPHRIMLADNKVFTVPLSLGVPFNWKDVTPVSMLALEPYILWTRTQDGYSSASAYINAAKAVPKMRMRGTSSNMRGAGSRQEERLLTAAIEFATSTQFIYLPSKPPPDGLQLREFDSALYKPMEGETLWRSGAMVPQCVFNDERLASTRKVNAERSWNDIPTCKEAGVNVTYQSSSIIFMGAGATDEQISYFVAVLSRVLDTAEWKAYMERGSYSQTFLTGPALKNCLARMEEFHKRQFMENGFLSKDYVSKQGMPQFMQCV